MRKLLLISYLLLISGSLFAYDNSVEPMLTLFLEPNVAYILLLLGLYAVILELATPGLILPGVMGAICIAVALYAFYLLPLNPLGLILMLAGIALIISDTFFIFFGILAIIGTVCFATGSFYLLHENAEKLSIAWPTILIMSLLTSAFFLFIINKAITARRARPITGQEQLIGSIAIADFDFEKTGTVRIGSEHWNAKTDEAVKKDSLVKIIAIHGLTLTIQAIKL